MASINYAEGHNLAWLTAEEVLAARGAVSVTDSAYAAKGDGVADDTAAFTAALAASKYVLVPPGTYLLTSTITLSTIGQHLIGMGGATWCVLKIDHVTGPGVTMAARQQVVSGIQIVASDTRQASGSPSNALISDCYGLKMYGSGSFTDCLVDRVYCQRHPNHGFYGGGIGPHDIFRQCESYYNRGHGFAFDDRTIGGGSSTRSGIVTLDHCRALDNGGNGLHLSQAGSTCYRFIIDNCEILSSAWNTSIASLVNAEMYIGGENHKVRQSGVGDNGDVDTKTTMANGDTRLAKATPSVGVFVRSAANNILLENIRYISTSKGVETGTGVLFLKIVGAFFSQQELSTGDVDQSIGFDIGTGCTSLDIEVPSSADVTTMVSHNSVGARVRVDGEEDVAVNGGDLTTTATTFNLLAGATGNIQVGAATTQFNIGEAKTGSTKNRIGGTFTGSSGVATQGTQFETDITGFAGNTSYLAQGNFAGTITTQGATETIANVATWRFEEPVITVGTGDTITDASTVLITGAPTEGTRNWALRATSGAFGIAGNVRIGSATVAPTVALDVTGAALVSSTLGVTGVTKVGGQNSVTGTPAFYVGDGTRTAYFGADASATTLTDATQKVARIGVPHYTNSEEAVGALFVTANTSTSVVTVGSGTSILNAPTRVVLNTAADNVTTTGSTQLQCDGPTAITAITGALTVSTTLGVTGAASNAIGNTASSSTALILPAGTTGVSSLRVPHGSAPTSPVNGDIWTTTAGLFVRVNGSTVGPLS